MDTQTPPDDLISPKKAARILGLHVATFYRWVKDGKVRAWTVRRLVRVSEREVRGMLRPKPEKVKPPSVFYSARARAAREADTRRVLEAVGIR